MHGVFKMKSRIGVLYDQLSYFVLSLAGEEMGDGWGLDMANTEDYLFSCRR